MVTLSGDPADAVRRVLENSDQLRIRTCALENADHVHMAGEFGFIKFIKDFNYIKKLTFSQISCERRTNYICCPTKTMGGSSCDVFCTQP